MKRSTFWKILALAVALVAAVGSYFFIIKPAQSSRSDLVAIRSEAELYNFYTGGYHISFSPKYEEYSAGVDTATTNTYDDYSTTNVQVANVDEADIIKTDGNFLYSISASDVIISDIRDIKNPKIATRIASLGSSTPVDLILDGDTLIIISESVASNFTTRYHYNYRLADTTVRVYDIKDRTAPRLEKTFTLYQNYYTSRRIENRLYIITSGSLRIANDRVDRSYEEDFETKEFAATDVHYLKDAKSDILTTVATVDLTRLDQPVQLQPFLFDISNAYVSESALYLLSKTYDYSEAINFKELFGLKGIIGYINYLDSRNSAQGLKTEIYKFTIGGDTSGVSYHAKTSVLGSTLNQYSLDEKDGNLRVALESNATGSYLTRVAVFDQNLKLLGESSGVGKTERMKSSRFFGDKVYLVTYRNTDPLFVVDLSNPTRPKVLGELKVDGYSTYLHPYDETHLIGIGVDTTEYTQKDENGRVVSSSVTTNGLKMSLFDVSDLKNPKEVSKISIGDRTTSSAILDNPKALLFSKERELIAVPSSNSYYSFCAEDSIVPIYCDGNNHAETYLVYGINLTDGLFERGAITHENSHLIRGAYVGDHLLTVSENQLKVNALSDLSLESTLTFVKEN
ncbi:beta-propeller domain-containing protein [Candidatus Saccharibacteria bacterium]|nr:beta-propeller domain-containing protein [Candidatus Saccharibacteria bacterium]